MLVWFIIAKRDWLANPFTNKKTFKLSISTFYTVTAFLIAFDYCYNLQVFYLHTCTVHALDLYGTITSFSFSNIFSILLNYYKNTYRHRKKNYSRTVKYPHHKKEKMAS